MNNQEFFDKTITHLRSQNMRSVDPRSGDCKYRWTIDGKAVSCAVGCHIPDDLYSSNMEGSPAQVLMSFPGISSLFKGVGISLMRALQCIHDAYYPPDWERRFFRVASDFNLTYTEPPKKNDF